MIVVGLWWGKEDDENGDDDASGVIDKMLWNFMKTCAGVHRDISSVQFPESLCSCYLIYPFYLTFHNVSISALAFASIPMQAKMYSIGYLFANHDKHFILHPL